MQISWLKNLIALQEDRVKEKIDDVYQGLIIEFSHLREQYINANAHDYSPTFFHKNVFDPFRSVTIGSILSSNEIEKGSELHLTKQGWKK